MSAPGLTAVTTETRFADDCDDAARDRIERRDEGALGKAQELGGIQDVAFVLFEPLHAPGEILAAVIEALQPPDHVERECLVAFGRGAVGLMAKPAEPPEPREPGSFLQDDHQEREHAGGR